MPHDVGQEEPLSEDELEDLKTSAVFRDACLHGEYESMMESFLPSAQSANLVFSGESVKKYLPPGGVAGLYRLYRGNCLAMNLKTAAWSTFWMVWHGQFKGTMEFRGKGQHGKCNTCEDFGQSLRNALTTGERIQISSHWDNHLNATFSDRRVYYHINDCGTRFWNGMQGTESMAGFILDGMDQAKFRCPRIVTNHSPMQASLCIMPMPWGKHYVKCSTVVRMSFETLIVGAETEDGVPCVFVKLHACMATWCLTRNLGLKKTFMDLQRPTLHAAGTIIHGLAELISVTDIYYVYMFLYYMGHGKCLIPTIEPTVGSVAWNYCMTACGLICLK
jgi:hypothetical protein